MALLDYMRPFFALQYPVEPPAHPDSFPSDNYYGAGTLDLCIVVTLVAIMALLRDVLRLFVFEPFAQWKLMRSLKRKCQKRALQNGSGNGHANGNGHVNGNGYANGKANGNGNGHVNANPAKPTTKELRQLHRSVLRFAEQGWSVVYYTLVSAYGLYVHYQLPTRIMNPDDLWLQFPHIPLAATVKFYYLTETAFYLHQMFILNAEARRKDHVQMMAHHIITLALMITSYFVHFTRVGCVIMVLMDLCDILLPLAKMIRYLNISQLLTDGLFGCFMLLWVVTRHVGFLIIIWSTMTRGSNLIDFRWAPEEGMYVTWRIYQGFIVALWMLQLLQIIWFGMVCRVAYRVVTGSGAADSRSDDEDSSDDTKKDD